MNVFFKNLAKLTTDFILESKFDCDQSNHLLGTTKVRSASTPKQAGSGMTLRDGQSSSWSQTSKWDELQAMAIPF